jgi:nitrogen fixation/metabolism regulation signal transduction histidine kinase
MTTATTAVEPTAQRTLWVGIQGRILGVFSIVYICLFVLLFMYLYNVSMPAGISLAVSDLAQRQAIIDMIHREMVIAFIPVFILWYMVLVGLMYFVARRLSRPISALAAYAQRVGTGDYTRVEVPTLGMTRDEINVVYEAFDAMVEQIRQREEQLKAQVAAMQITIDQTKRQRDVEEIVNSDYFAKLKASAKEMREHKADKDSAS